MDFQTTVGRGLEIVTVGYSVSQDGEMYLGDIETPAGVEVGGFISDDDYDSIEVAAWADYEERCKDAKEDAAVARWESRMEVA